MACQAAGPPLAAAAMTARRAGKRRRAQRQSDGLTGNGLPDAIIENRERILWLFGFMC